MKTQQTNIAEVSLIYMSKVKASDRPQIKNSQDAYNLFLEQWDHNAIEYVEEFKLLLLNCSNSVLGIMEVSKGGIAGTVTDIRIIFQAAIKANASGIIVCHNHPSVNTQPSESDSKLTQKIKEAGQVMDIHLLDHLIIIPENGYYSYADNGLI